MILAINTTTLQFGLAILKKDGSLLSEHLLSRGKGHFGGLMPTLDFMLARAGIGLESLEGIAVALGPGSFTGLRVGLSTAKGLSHSLDTPIIGVPSLDAMAAQLPHSRLPIVAVLDSRKDEYFTASYTWTRHGELKQKKEASCLRLDDFPLFFSEQSLFVGNDFSNQAGKLKKRLPDTALLAPAPFWTNGASAVGFLGLERFQKKDFDDRHSLCPLYLRPPDIRPH